MAGAPLAAGDATRLVRCTEEARGGGAGVGEGSGTGRTAGAGGEERGRDPQRGVLRVVSEWELEPRVLSLPSLARDKRFDHVSGP